MSLTDWLIAPILYTDLTNMADQSANVTVLSSIQALQEISVIKEIKKDGGNVTRNQMLIAVNFQETAKHGH